MSELFSALAYDAHSDRWSPGQLARFSAAELRGLARLWSVRHGGTKGALVIWLLPHRGLRLRLALGKRGALPEQKEKRTGIAINPSPRRCTI